MCAPLHGSQCDSPSPRPADRTTYTTGSDTGSGQRIRHGLRIVCRRPCPPYRLGARTHRKPFRAARREGGYILTLGAPKTWLRRAPFASVCCPPPGAVVRCPRYRSCRHYRAASAVPRCCPAAASAAAPLLSRCWSYTMHPCCPPGVPRSGWSATVTSGRDRTNPTNPTKNDNGHPIGVLLQQRPKCCSTLNSLALDDLGGACYNNNIFFPLPPILFISVPLPPLLWGFPKMM
jgi:hypothetical protein